MRVLVTGAAGTVGSVVAARLAREGMQVRAMVRRPAEVQGAEAVVADLADRQALADAATGADLVVHCAAALSTDMAECQRTNVQGTHNLVDALVDAGARRLVHVSTVSVYDFRAGLTFDEDSPTWTEPLDAYGWSKAEAERIVRAAPLSSVILRPVIILSMHPRSFWGPLAVERARASPGPIIPFTNLPYVHVDNLAEAVVLAARHSVAGGRAYNVVDGEADANAYLQRAYAALGRPAPPLPADAPTVHYAGDRIRRELGYAPADRWQAFLAILA